MFDGLIQVRAYGLFFVMGLFVFLWFFMREAVEQLRLSRERFLDIVFICLACGVAGARALYILECPEVLKHGLWAIINPRDGGLSVLGAVFASSAAAVASCWVFGVSALGFLDAAAKYVPLFDAFGRVGCLLGGCCYGVPTSCGFSVMYSDAAVAAPLGVDLLPIQAFMALAFLVLFGAMRLFDWHLTRRSLRAPGARVCVYFAGAGLIRFVSDFLRADCSDFIVKTHVAGVAISITWYQSISLFLMCAALLGLVGALWRAQTVSSESE